MNLSTKSQSYFIGCALVAVLVSIPVAFATETTAPKKEWAILTYLNGFNSLDSFGYVNMNQMETIGSTDRVHVVSQWASLKTRQANRIYVTRDSDTTTVTSAVVQKLGTVDMGDYRTLIDFVEWGMKTYPADHYFVNVWNHGNGWHFAKARGPIHAQDLSYDDISGNHITTEQLGQALAQIAKDTGKKIDLFGSDSCLMAMAEVAGEMKNSVGHFVGSEEVEPGNGWPYDTFLAGLNAGGSKTAPEVAEILSKTYAESYGDGASSATLSGMDLSAYGTLANAVRDLSDAIKTSSVAVRVKVLAAVTRTQAYESSDYKDLGDFVDQLSGDKTIPFRPEILAAVKAAVATFVIANHTTADQVRSHGVSIWLPDSSWEFDTYKERYKTLNFNQDTGWIDAITGMLATTTKL
jgi:hypothetical protein